MSEITREDIRNKKERKLEIPPYRTFWFNEGNRRTKTLRKLPERMVSLKDASGRRGQ